MKKIIFGILALFVAAGSASAVPSVDDRKTMCEKTDGYVWVEKTRACVPINPCLSDDEDIKKAYCPSLVGLPKDATKQKLVIDEYAQNVLHTNVLETKELGDTHVSVKTSDGGYFVWKLSKYSDDHCLSQMIRAFVVYGHVWGDNEDIKFEDGDKEGLAVSFSVQVSNDMECEKIISFASAMAGKDFKGRLDGFKCVLECADKTF